MAVAIGVLSFSLRAWKLSEPARTVWREGEVISNICSYQEGAFFLGKKQPFGDLLYFGVSKLFGLSQLPNISYFKESGMKWDGSSYVFFRLVSSAFSAATTSLFFLTAYLLVGKSLAALVFSAIAGIFENEFVVIGRIVSYESLSLFFNGAALLFCVLVTRTSEQRQTKKWTSNLLCLAISLGFSISISLGNLWLGVFVASVLAFDSWRRFCNKAIPLFSIASEFLQKFAMVITIPLGIYTLSYCIHVALLPNYGPDLQIEAGKRPLYSLRFREAFPEISSTDSVVETLYYGSQIKLRYYQADTVYLHSHKSNFETGSKQQQITGYPFGADVNNVFIVRRKISEHPPMVERKVVRKIVERKIHPTCPVVAGGNPLDDLTRSFSFDRTQESVSFSEKHESHSEFVPNQNAILEESTLDPVLSGDVIRLEHQATGRFLHSHYNEPPVSSKDHFSEVSGYGNYRTNVSDGNDLWEIKETDDQGVILSNRLKKPIRCQTAFIRLTHTKVNGILQLTRNVLPSWGFGQYEVALGRDSKERNGVWFISENIHPLMAGKKNKLASIVPKNIFERAIEVIQLRPQEEGASSSFDHGISNAAAWPFQRGNLLRMWSFDKVPNVLIRAANRLSLSNARVPRSQQSIEVPADLIYKNQQILLFANPFSRFLASFAIIFYLVLMSATVLFKDRFYSERVVLFVDSLCCENQIFLICAWAFSFVPNLFFSIEKQIFSTDYTFSYYVSLLVLVLAINKLCYSKAVPRSAQLVILGLLAIGCIMGFFRFSAFTFGNRLSRSDCIHLQSLLPTSTFFCDRFLQ